MKNGLTILFWFVAVGLFIFAYWTISEIHSEGGRCLNNPLVYGANTISNSLQSNLTCSCAFSGEKYVPFNFDKNGTYTLNFDPRAQSEEYYRKISNFSFHR